MIKIGYIYRYNETEGKGILVYGYNGNSKNIQTKPILFSKRQCISPIETGQMVYFELEDDFSVSQIERASLANFKRETLSDIVSCYDSQELSECHKATTIQYENLKDINLQGKLRRKISMPEKTIPKSITKLFEMFEATFRLRKIGNGNDNTDGKVPESLDTLFGLFEKRYLLHKRAVPLNIEGIDNKRPKSLNDLEESFVSRYWATRRDRNESKDQFEIITELPENMEELYGLFGNQNHQIHYIALDADDTCYVDILDINHWLDKDVAKSKCLYGTTAEQVIDVFEMFIKKRRNAYIRSSRKVDDSISPNWRYLLSNLPTEDLREICIKEPLLQPAMPRKFCLDNLDALSINQGFPSISICEAYYRYRICNTYSLAEYKTLFDRLLNATYCTVEHKKNEGVPPCKMKKKVLHELENLLEHQFRTVVLDNLKNKLSHISNGKIDEKKIISYLSLDNKDYLYRLDNYINNYEIICEDYLAFVQFVYAYNDLIDEDKESLKVSFYNAAKDCVIKIAKSEYEPDKAFNLYLAIQRFSNVLDSNTIDEARKIVNSEFVKLNDLKELEYAYSSNMITEDQYFKKFEKLTAKYDLKQLMCFIANNYTPLFIQEYLIKNIIKKFNFNYNNSEVYIRIENDSVYTKETLVKWLYKQKGSHLNCDIENKIALELVSDLDKDIRWRLYENGFISSPSYDNIREKLDYAYSHKEPNDLYRYILSDCFQQVMADDAINRTDFNQLSFILKHLNNDYKNQIIDNSSELLQFYLWAIEPNKSVDKNVIRKFFYSLPYYAQIRSFRFLFYLIATGSENYSVTELRDLITDDGKNLICYPLRIVLFLLEKKSSDLKASISNMEFRKAAALEVEPEVLYSSDISISFDSLKTLQIEINGEKTYIEGFFETCTGHRLLSWRNQFFDDITFNGEIDKHEENGEIFYVISFYFLPVDANGNSTGYSDDTDTWNAQQALERNIPNKKRNGRYWISVQYERDVRDFVIEYSIKDKYSLFCNNNSPTSPIQTYCSVQTINDKYSFCKGCKDCRSCDPQHNVPFYWCDKEPCISSKKLLTPIGKWEEYRFIDLLNILYENDMSKRDALWDAEAEVSQFLNSFVINAEETADSCPIIASDEIGEWKENMSIMSDKCLDDDYDDEYDNDYRYDPNSERATYNKYNGSYAQDEMGYSDDDIDTIFDGDPDAYWNID